MTNRSFEITRGNGWHSCRMEIDGEPKLTDVLDIVSECGNAILTLCRGYVFRGQEIKFLPAGSHGCDNPLKQKAEIVVTMFFDVPMNEFHGIREI